MKLSKSTKILLKAMLVCVIMVALSLIVPPLLSAPSTLMNFAGIMLAVGGTFVTMAHLLPSLVRTCITKAQ